MSARIQHALVPPLRWLWARTHRVPLFGHLLFRLWWALL
jgi:hypothetical protein